MSERLVEIPIKKELREKIKTIKDQQTYNDFLELLIENDIQKTSP